LKEQESVSVLAAKVGRWCSKFVPTMTPFPPFGGVRLDFELLNGITPERANKILDVLNENVIGVLVTTSLGDDTVAAR